MHVTLAPAAPATTSTSASGSLPSPTTVAWPRDGEVHLYWSDLESESVSSCASLSADEFARAKRFRFDRDRVRYTAARSYLRHVLSQYVGKAPSQLRFTYSAAGKPELAGAEQPLRFNLSHCEVRMLIGVSSADIGVDVERIAPLPDLDDIAREFFSRSDAVRILGADRAGRLERFYACWTRNEAFGKATGDGLRRNFAAPLAGEWTVITPNLSNDVAATIVVRHRAAWIGAALA